jgi:EmrB/QacA subfamily drug resistance transporter
LDTTRRVLAVASLGTLLTILAVTTIGTATVTLASDLDASLVEVQWVVTAYLLALTATVPVSVWASHRFGAKSVWLWSLGLFAAGSLLCGICGSIGELIAARAVQGIGAGLLIPVGQTIVVRAAGPAGLSRALATVAIVNVIGPATGPVVGGLVVDLVSWRWLFLGMVPIAVPLLLGAIRLLPHDPPDRARPLDLIGLGLLVPAAALATAGMAGIAEHARVEAEDAAMLGISLLLGVGFLLRSFPLGARAVVDVELLKTRNFRAGSTIAAIFGVLMFGFLFVAPIFWELARGYSSLEAGLLMLPQGAGSLVTLSHYSRRGDSGRVSNSIIVMGLVLAALGTAPFVFLNEAPTPLLELSLFVRGLGMGGVWIPALAATFRALAPQSVASASALINVALRFGSSAGTALMAAVLQQRLGPQASWIDDGLPGSVGPTVEHHIADAFAFTFGIALVATVIALYPARRLWTAGRLGRREVAELSRR